MNKLAVLLLLALPCFARDHSLHEQVLPSIAAGDGFFSDITVTNYCKKTQDLQLTVYRPDGSVYWDGTISVDPQKSWSQRLDKASGDDPVLWGTAQQVHHLSSCRTQVEVSVSRLYGEKIATVTNHEGIPAEEGFVQRFTTFHSLDTDAPTSDFVALNVSDQPTHIYFCMEYDLTGCNQWKPWDVPAHGEIFVPFRRGARILYQSESPSLFITSLTNETGMVKTFNAASTITFSALSGDNH